jgi:aminopeptidase-like protein
MPPVSLTAEPPDRNDQEWERHSTEIGQEIYQLIAHLYPICRSITGNGVRATLKILREYIPLEIREVPTGTQVFDWTVPKEWNIKTAYVKDSRGKKIIDFEKSNLHVLSYSVPVRAKLHLEELKEHLYTLPEHPDWIPYRTSYYKENWGFCLSHKQLLELPDGDYEVVIDTSLEDGYLTYGEFFLKGDSDSEILISTHVCHPSLANDNLSGVALATFLAKHLSKFPSRYSYRFLFTPGTIGSIAWLSLNEARASRIKHGLVLACLGDPGTITYKKSRRGDAEIDRTVNQILRASGESYKIREFVPFGYDERQFCSPGFDLPVGCLMRTPHGEFSQYHTSADDLDFIQPEHLADSFFKCAAVLQVLEGNRVCLNLSPKCEPQLGKRGLYGDLGGQKDGKLRELAMLWVLNLSDDNHDLLAIAEKSGLPFDLIQRTADTLVKHQLLKDVTENKL